MPEIKKLIQTRTPDGILASVERLAISTLRVAKAEKIGIPDQLKLICFSCLDIADMLDPSLSVVKQPAYEMGRLASQFLFEQIEKPIKLEKQEVTYLNSTLIFQDSSKKI
jgi:LacI family transcriptional regulator